MLRHLCRSFQGVLKFQQPSTIKTTNIRRNAAILRLKQRTQNSMDYRPQFMHQNVANFVEETTTANANDKNNKSFKTTDHDYIVPYHIEKERIISEEKLVEALQAHFRLTNKEIEIILNDQTVNRMHKERNLINTMEILCLEGITKHTFVEYPWLLTLDSTQLNEKFRILRQLPMKDINHFAPFLRLTLARLRKLVKNMKNEIDHIPTGNRLYYMSEKMKKNPEIIAKYVYKRLFILEMPFDVVERNLAYMLEYNVAPSSILKDLWAFRYAPRAVKTRLERAKRAKKEKLMPWMVRCPERILQRSIQRKLNERQVLGDKSSTVEYVAARLGFDINETKGIMDKHPLTHNVRVTKIKEVLDYLLNEVGVKPYDVALVPRILCHGLKTTKARLTELKNIGCRPTTLVVVCRSKREYKKFVNTWMQKQNMRQNTTTTTTTTTAKQSNEQQEMQPT